MSSSWHDKEAAGNAAVMDRPRVEPPARYKVIMHDDDETPMPFVVSVLVQIYQKSQTEAESLTLKVHEEGRAVVAVYPRDIAEAKIFITKASAQQHGFPLNCTQEKV